MKWIITIVSMTAVAALVVGGAQAGGASSRDFLVGAAERPAVGVPGVFVHPVVAERGCRLSLREHPGGC